MSPWLTLVVGKPGGFPGGVFLMKFSDYFVTTTINTIVKNYFQLFGKVKLKSSPQHEIDFN
jgi:hypothetical protein